MDLNSSLILNFESVQWFKFELAVGKLSNVA